jgi:hypothetical protein|tara:strand:- start:4477 stop:4668 length:192 start_codon:yes stop_codon:yes gene_type:complete
MTNTSCTIRTRKFMTNRLLQRRQFVRVARASERENQRRGRGRDDGAIPRRADASRATRAATDG